jgi:hypothetical protein
MRALAYVDNNHHVAGKDIRGQLFSASDNSSTVSRGTPKLIHIGVGSVPARCYLQGSLSDCFLQGML